MKLWTQKKLNDLALIKNGVKGKKIMNTKTAHKAAVNIIAESKKEKIETVRPEMDSHSKETTDKLLRVTYKMAK